jgi:hypothetical protein
VLQPFFPIESKEARLQLDGFKPSSFRRSSEYADDFRSSFVIAIALCMPDKCAALL